MTTCNGTGNSHSLYWSNVGFYRWDVIEGYQMKSIKNYLNTTLNTLHKGICKGFKHLIDGWMDVWMNGWIDR